MFPYNTSRSSIQKFSRRNVLAMSVLDFRMTASGRNGHAALENDMQAIIRRSLGRPAIAIALALSVMAPGIAEAGKKERAIALGIGIGMLGGALASNGDPRAVLGGAVAGGLIGSVADKDRRDRRDERRSWRDDRYRGDGRWDRRRPYRHEWR
jgi:hypothetical protein